MYTIIFLLLICASATANQNCTRRQEDADRDGRFCRKPCVSNDDCKGKKKCLCDGACGMSCFNNESECGEPERIENGQVNRNHIRWSGVASYSCNAGFYLNGTLSRTCHSNRKWSRSQPTCERGCAQSSDGDHSYALYQARGFRVGESYEFVCDTGYVMRGRQHYRTCRRDFEWSYAAYMCVLPQCDVLPSVEQGSIQYTNGRDVGSTATVSCDLGYQPTSMRPVECLAGKRGSRYGKWNGTLPECRKRYCPRLHSGEHCRKPCVSDEECHGKKKCLCDGDCGKSCFNDESECPEPEAVEHGHVGRNYIRWGGTAVYSCDDGYYLNGTRSRTCLSNRQWSGSPPTCEGGCIQPSNEDNSFPKEGHTGFRVGQSYEFVCGSGYYMRGRQHSRRTCREDFRWSPANYTCELQQCDALAPVDHGEIRYSRGRSFGSRAFVQCDIGYQPTASHSINCFPGERGSPYGEWTEGGNLPECRAISCNEPKAPDHGTVESYSAWEYGKSVAYKCGVGYKITGSSVGVCNENGTWGSPPTCVVDADCSFGNFRTPTCGYNNNGNRWSRILADEPGGLQGYVLRATTAGSTLVSMELPRDSAEEICIRFHFKLTRSDREMARLKIESTTHVVFWESHENENDTWHSAVINIDMNGPLQYQFTDMRGTVMLDDVQVLGEKCEDHCKANPCLNGGTCVRRIATYTCFCTNTFKGDTCQTDRRCKIPPGAIRNGQRTGGYGSRFPSQRIYYSCNSNHKFSGIERIKRYWTITCQETSSGGKWDHDPASLRCEEITCDAPYTGENQVIEKNQRSEGTWTVGDSVTYRCKTNYLFDDYSTTTKTSRCKDDGTWSITRPKCIRGRCTIGEDQRSPKSGRNFYYAGEKAAFYCAEGHSLTGQKYLTCIGHQKWNDTVPRCNPVSCGIPPHVNGASRNAGRSMYYKQQWDYVRCTPTQQHRFYMDGSRRIICQANGAWSNTPVCRAIKNCGDKEDPLHGKVLKRERTLSFSCNRLYELRGQQQLTCNYNGTWSSDAPTCQEMKPTTSMLYEGIEYLVYAGRNLLATFDEAQELCSTINGNLAVLYNAEVTGRLVEHLRNVVGYIYLGIRRKANVGTSNGSSDSFNWIDDDNILTELPEGWKRYTYRNWYKYYPYGRGNCGAIYKSTKWFYSTYKWLNVHCYRKRYFVCQRNRSPCLPNPCDNGGDCEIRNGGFFCLCKRGYKGETCGEEASCVLPDPPSHARWNESRNHFPGESVQLICDPGFQYIGSDSIRRCRSDGSWDGNNGGFCGDSHICDPNPCRNGGTCTPSKSGYSCHCPANIRGTNCEQGRPCQRPSSLPDRAYSSDRRTEYPVGSEVRIRCLGPRTLDGGVGTLTCLANGSWTQTQATCKANVCFLSPAGLELEIEGVRGGATIRYQVNETIIIVCRGRGNTGENDVQRTVSTCKLGGRFDPNVNNFKCDQQNQET